MFEMNIVQRYLPAGCLFLAACLICHGKILEAKDVKKVESFAIECNKPVESGFYGVSRMVMQLGEEAACTLFLDHKAIGLPSAGNNKLSSNLRTTTSETVIVLPEHGETDGNGRLKFSITAKKDGSEWISWAVAGNNGEFDFSKDALAKGLASGLFVTVEK